MTQRFAQDLELILDGLIVEHRNLLALVQKHSAAMKVMNLTDMDELARQKDACRSRVAALDRRRKLTVQSIAREARLSGEPTLTQIADLYPQHAQNLREKRDSLRKIAADVALRTNVGAKLASAVLGHLNTAVRAIAGAVQSAGVYTQSGVPKVSSRIGAMEAVA
jgi:hypothetical protein